MKMIILAAGVGERLYPLTKTTPKSLLNFGDGSTLLERQIENAKHAEDITQVAIVTGYKTEQIEAKLNSYRGDMEFQVIYNPFFHGFDNFVSLWCAQHLMTEHDFVITNGDNIYKEEVFARILQRKDTIQLTIDKKDRYDEDDMKVLINPKGLVERVHKSIPADEAMAESVGLVLVSGARQRQLFVAKIQEMVRQEVFLHRFWLEIFNELARDGVPVDTVEIGKDDWREMDFHPDVESIKNAMARKLF